MPRKAFLYRPEALRIRLEEGTVRQGQYMSGHIAVDAHPVGHHHFVFFTDAHEAFFEGSVAQPAQSQAVGRQVIVTLAPRYKVFNLEKIVLSLK